VFVVVEMDGKSMIEAERVIMAKNRAKKAE
jgi:hypothetical protein